VFSLYFQADKQSDSVTETKQDVIRMSEPVIDRYFSAASDNKDHSVFSREAIDELIAEIRKTNNTSRWRESRLINIFKTTFWVNSTGQHPSSGQLITHNDVTQFVWRPTDQHYTDFCRYVTLELEKEGCGLRVNTFNRKVLFICDPQNDFCDNVPALVSFSDLILEDGRDNENDCCAADANPMQIVDTNKIQELVGHITESGVSPANEHSVKSMVRNINAVASNTIPDVGPKDADDSNPSVLPDDIPSPKEMLRNPSLRDSIDGEAHKESNIDVNRLCSSEERVNLDKFDLHRWQRAINRRRVALKPHQDSRLANTNRSGFVVGLKMKVNHDHSKDRDASTSSDSDEKAMACGGYYVEVRWTERHALSLVSAVDVFDGIDVDEDVPLTGELLEQPQTPIAASPAKKLKRKSSFSWGSTHSFNSDNGAQTLTWNWKNCKRAVNCAVPVFLANERGKQGIIINIWLRDKIINFWDKKFQKTEGKEFSMDDLEAEILWNARGENQDNAAKNTSVDYEDNSLGSLAPTGSFADFQRTSSLIKEMPGEFDEIFISRDCHRFHHIAHQPFW
jgi:hypothetical protein